MARDHPQVRRNGPYAPLSAFYADDDAIAALDEVEDDRSELLFVRGIAFCARDPKLNGGISAVALRTGRVLRRKPVKGRDIIYHAEQLVKVQLWTPDSTGYRITKWAKWNRTAEEIQAVREADAARKRPGRGTDSATE